MLWCYYSNETFWAERLSGVIYFLRFWNIWEDLFIGLSVIKSEGFTVNINPVNQFIFPDFTWSLCLEFLSHKNVLAETHLTTSKSWN